MPNLGGGELIGLVVILVMIFGAKKLPELGSSIGKSIKNFKKGMEEAHADDEEPREQTSTARSDPDQR